MADLQVPQFHPTEFPPRLGDEFKKHISMMAAVIAAREPWLWRGENPDQIAESLDFAAKSSVSLALHILQEVEKWTVSYNELKHNA